jgi:peptide/nickel transport system substrate-binding protein
MPLDRYNRWPISRRSVLKGTAAVAAAAASPWAFGGRSAQSASPPGTMVIAAPATPQSLDSDSDVSLGTFEAVASCYDSLVEFEKIPDAGVPTALREDIADHPDKPGGVNLKGKLAESWELDPAGTWATFNLRQGVTSNWGNPLTAEDVVWTWHRKLGLEGIGRFYCNTLGITSPDQIKAEGPMAVKFDLGHPNPLLLKLMVNLYNPIYDAKKCKEMSSTDDPWAKKFIENETAGFGPYRIEQLVRGQQAVYKGREDYYAGKPAMDTVIFKEVPTSANRVQLLQGGAVDIAQYLQPLELISLQKAEGVTVETVPATFMLWIELNAKIEPFNNVDVRRAMNFAFPQEQVIKTVFQSLASPLDGAMPDIYPGFTDAYFEYGKQDLDKARELLKDAGLGDGFQTVLAYNAGDPVQEPTAILYQTALKEIGVDLQLRKVPAATFYNFVSERKQPMIFYFDSPWCPDPGYSMNLYFHSKSFVNYSNYENARVDELIDAAARTADNAERFKMMDEVQKIVMAEAPWTFGVFTNYSMARRSDLQGWTYYTSNNIRFQDFHR